MGTERVNKLLQDIRLLDEDRYTLVQALRKLILKLDAGVTEDVKYGGLYFSGSKPFCGVFSYTKHVTLEFGRGASLSDPHQMLEGEGKYRRHIKLTSQQDIGDKHVHAYLVLAFKESVQTT